ncbi:MAG: hypothetical protein PHY28_01660 [Dehalococcoidales bacterium]|nr:hypothetical protein [Dehalococcoidales bacterium]
MKRILFTSIAILLLTLCLQVPVMAAPGNLTNPGFETGNLTGWTKGNAFDFAGVIGVDTFTSPNGSYSLSPYSGNYMVRLGTPRYEGQPVGDNLVYQDFVVAAPQVVFMYNIFTFDYQGFNHFHYTVRNLTTNTVITAYSQGAWGSGTGLKTTGWQLVTINLSAYIGNTVRLEVECGGSSDTAYATWAYFDARDDIPPVTTAARTPEPNAAGWNNTDVTVNLTAVDNPNGTGVKEIHYRINGGSETIIGGATASFSISTEGTHNVTFYAIDNSGNAETIKSIQVNIDKTPPTITGARTTEPNAAGWNNTDVTIHFTAADALSGVASVTSDTTVSAQGANQSVNGTVTDKAGNSASTTVTNINIDKTPPTVNFSTVSPAPNAAGWNNSDVSMAYTVSDSLSGVASDSPGSPLSFNAEGKDLTQTITVADNAGNGTTITSPKVSIDKTPPTLTFGTASPAPNAAGWNNSNVSVPFTTADSLSGVASTSPAASPVILTADGTAVTGTATVTDMAGNSATLTTTTFNIDKTPPTITATRTPAPNASGWNNTDVTVHFTATDATAGVDTVSDDVVVTAEGTGQSASGTATDKAGNTTTLTVNDINIDKTPPTITGTRTPDPNAAGWNNSDVTVHFTAADALSGVASVTPDTTVSAQGANQSVNGTVTDKAGNSASTTVTNINIDKTPPTVTISSPQNRNYVTSETLVLNFGANDALSGILSTSASLDGNAVSNGQTVNLAAMAGSHTLTVTSKDKAGNERTNSVTFSVIVATTIDIDPNTLNLKSKSDKNAITVFIELAAGYDVKLIDVSTAKMTVNGITIAAQLTPTSIGNYNKNKIPDLMVKFERQAVINALNGQTGNIPFTITGQMEDGYSFTGSDTIKVINPGK